jgi:hypothetical protein
MIVPVQKQQIDLGGRFATSSRKVDSRNDAGEDLA